MNYMCRRKLRASHIAAEVLQIPQEKVQTNIGSSFYRDSTVYLFFKKMYRSFFVQKRSLHVLKNYEVHMKAKTFMPFYGESYKRMWCLTVHVAARLLDTF